MAFTKDGDIIDLYGGKEDIENKVIRAVGDPNVRFREDVPSNAEGYSFWVSIRFYYRGKKL